MIMNKTSLTILNDYLKEVITNSGHCSHCKYRFETPEGSYCFMAYDCIKNDFNRWDEDD